MKFPVMKFDLDNATIVDAIRAAVEAGGMSLDGKHVRISFKSKRVGPDAGLSATVEVSSDPFLEAEPKATAKRGPKPQSAAADVEVVEEVTEPEVTEVEEAPVAKTATKKKALFATDDTESA